MLFLKLGVDGWTTEFTCRLNTFHTSNSGSVVLTWALLNHGIVYYFTRCGEVY
jgi:hypothetical protein